MKIFILLISVLSVFAISVTDRSSAIQNIKNRNGDVYILLYPENNTTGEEGKHGVWRFIRGDDYPDDTKYKRQYLPNFTGGVRYSGLTVDKFGRIFVFREKASAQESILDKTNVFPGQAGARPALMNTNIVRLNQNGDGCAAEKALNGSPMGWVYAIADNGDEGWVQFYDFNKTSLYNFGDRRYVLKERNNAFLPDGVEILPPLFKSVHANWVYDAHKGFWGGTEAEPAIEMTGSVQGGSVFCGDPNHGKKEDNKTGHGGDRYAEWNVHNGTPCGSPIHPMVGAFFMHPVVTGHNNNNLAAVRVCDVEVETRKLYFDQYMTDSDYKIIQDSMNYLVAPGQKLEIPTSPNQLFANNRVLATSVGSNTVYARFNHCGDMCGAPGVQAPTILTQPGKAVGAVSSVGVNDSEQRQYILKSSTSGGTYITGVVKVQSYVSKELIRQPEGGAIEYKDATSSDEFQWNGSINGSRFSSNKFLVDTMRTDLNGWKSYITSVQTSKRTLEKDWVYYSNPPNPAHFRVSESFWGTGGIIWFLKDADVAPNGASLVKKQYNHENGNEIESRVISLQNEGEVVGFGADGDGFVYWLEIGFVEGLDDLKKLLGGSAPTWTKILNSGKLVSPAGLPAPAPGETSVAFTIEVKREAGLALKKTVTGGEAYLVGTVPTEAANCKIPVSSYSADPDFPLVYSDPGWDGNPNYCGKPGIDENLTVEMAVVNIANPPASSGSFTLDIVNVPEILEGQRIKFYMENPPRFDGPPAQLGQAGGPKIPKWAQDNFGAGACSSEVALRKFHYPGILGSDNPNGYVRTVSNYTASGNDIVLTELEDAAVGVSGPYKDNDGVDGMNLPSFIMDTVPDLSCFPFYKGPELIVTGYDKASNKYIVTKEEQTKTLRVRWEVRALTPPLSLKTGHPNIQSVFQPGGIGKKQRCQDVVKGGDEGFSPMDEPGLIYFECYRDIQIHKGVGQEGDTDGDGVPDQTEVVSNEILFPDPGVYEVKLSMTGFRWNADELTFEDDSSGVTYEVTEATAVYQINVKPRTIKGDGYVKDIDILNRYASSISNAFYGRKDRANRLVVEPVNTMSHMLVTEGYETPLVGQATIQFFQAVNKEYIQPGSSGNLMQKFNGVGSWDHGYPGDDGVGGNNDKTKFHPPNWMSGSGINDKAGNDATNDLQSNVAVDDSGKNAYDATDPNNIPVIWQDPVMHIQGTYSSDNYYTGSDMSSAKEAMFDWWEIKYYWFMRYKHPVTGQTEGPFLIRQGNLSEIWAIHNFADNEAKQRIAPSQFNSGKPIWGASKFIIKDSSGFDRKYHVRIPLIKPDLCIGTDKISGDADCVIDWNTLFGKANFKEINSGNYPDFNKALQPYIFEIPTEPTALEFSLLIDAPRMGWVARNPTGVGVSDYKAGATITYGTTPDIDNISNIGPSNFNSWVQEIQDNATYFDAVYWGPNSNGGDVDPFQNPDPKDAGRSITQADTRIGSDTAVAFKFNAGKNNPNYSGIVGGPYGFYDKQSKLKSPLHPKTKAEQPVSLWGSPPDYITGGLFQEDNNASGGLSAVGVYSRDSGVKDDDWYDVIIRDDTPPMMTVVGSGSSISLTGNLDTLQSAGMGGFEGFTGGMLQSKEGIVIAVVDNNPYQHWTNFKAGLEVDDPASSQVYWWAPFLQQAYYEIGNDPRNLRGLGLKTGLTAKPCVPGYFVSRPIKPSDAENQKFSDWEDQLLRDISGEDFFSSQVTTISDNCSFYYEGTTLSSFNISDGEHNRKFFKMHNNQGDSLCYPYLLGSASGNITPPDVKCAAGSNPVGFSQPATVRKTYINVIDDSGNVSKQQNNSYVIAFGPDAGNKEFGASGTEGVIKFIDSPGAYKSLDGVTDTDIAQDTTSIFENIFDRNAAFRKTIWWIPQDAFILPYFLSAASSGQDVFGIWAKSYDISTLSFRQGVDTLLGREDAGMLHPDSTTTAKLEATLLGEFKVSDNRPPNVKITFFDYKETEFFRILLLDDYAHEFDAKSSSSVTTGVIIMRTKDPRNQYYDEDVTQSDFTSGRIPEASNYSYRLDKPDTIKDSTGKSIYNGSGKGNGAGIFNVKIAEDVRFRIKVEATDNASGPADLKIVIESDLNKMNGSENVSKSISEIGSQYGGSYFERTSTPVTEENRFKRVSSETKVYQFQGFQTGYHLYPLKGFYDVIKVSVADKIGNQRTVYFPIEIVEQNVHFRSLGNQNKVR